MTPDRALIGELSTQLQEAMQARTNMGVTLRLTEARARELEEENRALQEEIKALKSRKRRKITK